MTRLLFRLHPVFYWIASAALLALALVVHQDLRGDNADRAAALASEPPAAVALEHFDPARHANAAEEAVILATVETSAMYTLTRETYGVPIKRWVAPLRPAGGGGEATEIRAAIYERDGALPQHVLQGWVVGENGGRPVVRLHGVLERVSGKRRDQIEEAFAEQGLNLVENAVFIDPFLGPRAKELAPKDAEGVTAVVAGAGGLLFLYGFFRRWMRRRRRAKESEANL